MSKLKAETLAHYDRLLGCRFKAAFFEEGYHSKACPLCEEYCSGHPEEWCMGCPVNIETKQTSCYGSPWYPMATAIRLMGCDEVLQEPLPEVVAMRKFLEGLDWSNQP